MTNHWTDNDLKIYSSLFDISKGLVGQRIDKIQLYLNNEDTDYNEQPNNYGKSLLNGFDISINGEVYSIGNRFTEVSYGLTISAGKTSEIEFIEEDKKLITFPTTLTGQVIKNIEIYWMRIPIVGAVGYYPQEIQITTNNNFLLISSIEVNQGEINTEFTNETLLVDNLKIAQLLSLGQFGVLDNGREFFKTFEDLYEQDNKNWG
jgi:ribosome-associated toxin RatA of RatAB toxin-antitoxin module